MDELSNIKNNSISLKTKRRYHSTAYAFIIWAYHNHRGILRPEFSEQVDAVLLVPRSTSAQRKAFWTLVITQWLDKMEHHQPEQKNKFKLVGEVDEVINVYKKTADLLNI